jgi:hypothetical protein
MADRAYRIDIKIRKTVAYKARLKLALWLIRLSDLILPGVRVSAQAGGKARDLGSIRPTVELKPATSPALPIRPRREAPEPCVDCGTNIYHANMLTLPDGAVICVGCEKRRSEKANPCP